MSFPLHIIQNGFLFENLWVCLGLHFYIVNVCRVFEMNYLEVSTASCCLSIYSQLLFTNKYSWSLIVFLFNTHHICTIIIWIEAWAYIYYKQFITRHYLSPFCILHRCVFTLEHWTSAFIWAQAYEPCFYLDKYGT